MSNTPNFYDAGDVGNIYQPRLQMAHEAGVDLRSSVNSAAKDDPRILLWLIDLQVDFVHPDGNLAVPGAVEDTQRTIEWIYAQLGQITTIAASLDTHFPFQIFHALWWVDENGNNPDPFTQITVADVNAGTWKPLADPKGSIEYLRALEQGSKKTLMVWPYHCFEGSVGRSLIPALTEAISVHSSARYAQPTYLTKGTIPTSEFYSVVEPEVHVPNHPQGGLNTEFLTLVSRYDLVYVAGQARSHCVLETMSSVMRNFANTPEVIKKLRFLDDCTSSIPGFEQQTENTLNDFAAQGMTIVKTADPIG